MSKYEYLPDDPEISGFGGGYEAACRKMVKAGMEWFDAHPKADPQYRGFKGVYGVLADDNADARALSKCMVDATGGDCTGAMHQACVGHALHARKVGWGAYLTELRRAESAGERK